MKEIIVPALPLQPLSSVRGHERSLAVLAQAVREDRLYPSLIFHGPEGVGKATAALALAAALVCERPDGTDACTACRACLRVTRAMAATSIRLEHEKRDQAMQYPDVGYIAFLHEGNEKPEPRRRRAVLVSQVRDLIHSVEQQPLELKRRIYIIDHAESLTREAQNALLKTLEEPPGNGVVILLSTSRGALLPTTRSRCQSFPFAPLSEDALRDLLVERGVDPEEAASRAALAEGRVGRALALDLDEARADRDLALDALEEVLASPEPAAAAVRSSQPFARSPQDAPPFLELLGEIARDLVILAAESDTTPLVHREAEARLRRIARAAADPVDGASRLELLRRRAAVFNLNPRMTVEAALLAVTGRGAADASPPPR